MRLDMRNPQARAHLDTVIDRMVSYGIGYLKIDDNFSVGSGPDEDADSPGDGLLGHCRAWAAWLADLPRRHPGLVVENCASGA
ncbi:alpha-galactosidase [Cutibacterium acnes JCM 18918]|nr:alpha-galactosidase [Cutibacterium acnes JCM 18918]